MKRMTIDEIRQVELNLLDDYSCFCEQNGLKYYLWYGTLLGAIRHKGFIPWDDDIDVVMPREDYMRFMDIYSSKCYTLKTPYNDKTYYYAFAKLCDDRTVIREQTEIDTNIGVYIDIFPIERVTRRTANVFYIKKSIYRFVDDCRMALRKKKRPIFKTIILKVFGRIFTYVDLNRIAVRLDQAAVKSGRPNGKSVGCIEISKKSAALVPAQVLEETVRVEFEGREYAVPSMHHDVLTHLYGNYMELPPVEERVSHMFDAFWKESSERNSEKVEQ